MSRRTTRHNVRAIQSNATRRAGIDPKKNAVGVAARTAYFKTLKSNHASNLPMVQQPSAGEIGLAFYRAMFGKVARDE